MAIRRANVPTEDATAVGPLKGQWRSDPRLIAGAEERNPTNFDQVALDRLLASVDLLLMPVMPRAVWSLEALAAAGRDPETVGMRLCGHRAVR